MGGDFHYTKRVLLLYPSIKWCCVAYHNLPAGVTVSYGSKAGQTLKQLCDFLLGAYHPRHARRCIKKKKSIDLINERS